MSVEKYKDKVVIVTGGCKGIGRACADIFFENGGKVAVWDKDDEIGNALKDITGAGEMFFIHCDMTKETDITSAVDKTVAKFQKVDCLVNNAGWHPKAGLIDDFSGDDLRKLLDINVVGYYLACKFALPHIRRTKGCVVNISSMAGCLGEKESITYCCTKGGVTAMSRALAIDEAPNGVRVNAISPGSTWTPLMHEHLETLCQEYVDNLTEFNLVRRLGEPREIGKLCFFLATDATYMTGEDVHCSGGEDIGYGLKYF